MNRNKRQNFRRRNVRPRSRLYGLRVKVRKIRRKIGLIEKRSFWKAHLPWPKFLHIPKLRFIAPRIQLNLPIPGRSGMFVLALVVVGFSIAGGAYDLVSKTLGNVAVGVDQGGNPIFFYPEINEQYLLEGIIAASLVVIGFMGFLFIHKSAKYFYSPRHSYMLITLGISMIMFAFFSLTYIVIQGKGIEMYYSFPE